MNLLTQNSKMKKMSGPKTYNFGIPAKTTCPQAKDCLKFCYAQKGAYRWPVVRAAYSRRLELTKSENFLLAITNELDRKKVKRLRLHDSGDIYSEKYLSNLINLAQIREHIIFYAYTKSVKLIKDWEYLIPKNFILIFSLGGKQDHLIDLKNDRHSKIFDSTEALKAASYIDASQDDSMALTANKKVGLVMH